MTNSTSVKEKTAQHHMSDLVLLQNLYYESRCFVYYNCYYNSII